LDLPPYAWQQQHYWLPPAQSHSRQQANLSAELVSPTATQNPSQSLSQELRSLPPAAQLSQLQQTLRQQLAAALQQDPADVDLELPLKHLGIGSLMGME